MRTNIAKGREPQKIKAGLFTYVANLMPAFQFFSDREREEVRRDVIVVHCQGGMAKAEMRTCDEHVVPACTKFPVSRISTSSAIILS